MSVKIIRRFPDITQPGFEFSKWNRQFETHNVILNGLYNNYYYPVHWTPLSIKCAFGGSEYYIANGVKYAVNNKRYLILNDGTLYESLMNSEKKVESFTINFQKEFAEKIFCTIANSSEKIIDEPESPGKITSGFFEKLYEHDAVTISVFTKIRNHINQSNVDELALSQLLHLLLGHMYRVRKSSLRRANELKAERKSTRIELYKRLTRAKDFIYSNYNGKIGLETLSKIACLSEHHFLRSFRSAFGKTPHRFLTQIRIEKAKEMLKETEMPVTDICSSVGFESLSSFGVLFKRHEGCPPENFRLSFKKAIFK